MTCEKHCLHWEVCKLTPPEYATAKYYTFCNCAEKCECFKNKFEYKKLPFIAMIEQHLVKGEFVNNSLQNWNGKYTVVYIDKNKSDAPLIDICGKFPYDADEAQERLKELLNDN